MTTYPARRVALVTGASSGIGAAVAAALRTTGWTVAGLDLRWPGPETDPGTGAGPRGGVDLALAADVADARAVRAAAERVEQELGPVDALVNAAGHYEMTPVDAITPEQWTRMLRVHLGGLANTARAVLPSMAGRGSGSLVAISSELAIGGGDGGVHYAAAKGAAIGLVRSLAAEFGPRGVRVNAVAPGPTDTPLLAADSPWRSPEVLSALPARRLARPDEIAAAVLFLLEEGTFCNGEVLSPNSGAVI